MKKSFIPTPTAGFIKISLIAGLLAAFAIVGVVISMQTQGVSAATPPSGTLSGDTQVKLCHDNQGASDYSLVQAKVSSIVSESNQGHPPDATHVGDIIPPFDYEAFSIPGNGPDAGNYPAGNYPGRNWSVDFSGLTGEEIFTADCKTSTTGEVTGTLTIVKVIAGNDVTGVTPDDFDFQINGESSIAFEADGSNDIELNIGDGPFTVTEVNTSNAVVTYQGCENIDLTEDGATCTITNTFEEPPINYCDASQVEGGIENWVPSDVNCVEIDVATSCGVLSGTVTNNVINMTPNVYGISWSEGSPDYNFNTSLPATFPEDYNGGSVEVYYWIVGSESGYVTGRDLPTFWEQNAESITVDTDCQEPKNNSDDNNGLNIGDSNDPDNPAGTPTPTPLVAGITAKATPTPVPQVAGATTAEFVAPAAGMSALPSVALAITSALGTAVYNRRKA